jgi:cytochrome c553
LKKAILISCTLLFIGCSESDKTKSTSEESYKEELKKVESATTKVVQPVADEVEDVKEETVKTTQKVVDKVEQVATTNVVTIKSGSDLYQSCIACHGKNAEKVALGKSKVIKGWPASKITNALKGYKDGSYGGSMKGLMKGQVSALTEDEIEAVAEYISNL